MTELEQKIEESNRKVTELMSTLETVEKERDTQRVKLEQMEQSVSAANESQSNKSAEMELTSAKWRQEVDVLTSQRDQLERYVIEYIHTYIHTCIHTYTH